MLAVESSIALAVAGIALAVAGKVSGIVVLAVVTGGIAELP